MSGPLPGCESCRKTKSWEFWCKVGCTERTEISASQITSSFVGRLQKKTISRIAGMCPVLYKLLELVSAQRDSAAELGPKELISFLPKAVEVPAAVKGFRIRF